MRVQNLPPLKGSSVEGALKGAYTIQEAEGEKPDIIFVATGSEVSIAVQAADSIKDKKVPLPPPHTKPTRSIGS